MIEEIEINGLELRSLAEVGYNGIISRKHLEELRNFCDKHLGTKRLIFQRFTSASEAIESRDKDQALMKGEYQILNWLYSEDIPGESRLNYLKRLSQKSCCLKGPGYKELEKLEKQQK